MRITNGPSIRRQSADALLILGAAVAYALCVRLLLATFPTMDFTGAFHPWIGVSLALLLRNWRRTLPGVLFGTLAVQAITTGSAVAGIAMAVAAIPAYFFGAWLIARSSGPDFSLRSLRDYLCLLIFGGGVSGLLCTLGRTAVLYAAGVVPGDGVDDYILHWWMGEALGVALVAPLILVCRFRKVEHPRWPRVAVGALLLLLCFLMGQIIFLDWFVGLSPMMTSGYWMFLLIVVVAISLGVPGTAFVLMMTAVQAFSGAYFKTGIFVEAVFGAGLIDDWMYLMNLSLVGMALATYVSERKRVEAALREKEQLLGAAMDMQQVGVYVVDRNGSIESSNAAARRIMSALKAGGTSMNAGFRAWRYGTEQAIEPHEWAAARALEKGETTVNEELEMETADGSRMVILNAARPLFDRDGNVVRAVIAAADITSRKQAEEILRGETLETLSQRDNALKEITQGVVIANADRIATYVNDAFTSKTGFAREEIIGRRCSILHGPETSRETVGRMRALLDAQLPFQGEILNYRKDGTTFWNDLTITPVFGRDGKLSQWVGVQRDITDRKQDHARIERLNKLYAALSHCNNAIVHAASREELFQRVCEGAVRHGGMKLAWIGTIGTDGTSVTPAAKFGSSFEYLDQIDIRLDAGETGLSTTPSALMSNQAIWCQDIMVEPANAPWHAAAVQHGIRSMAALPLRMNGGVVGNFTLYSDTIDAFDEEACNLLLEMARDVSFALENFEREAARLKAEAQNQLAANVIAQNSEALVVTNAERKMLMVNKAFTDITGHKAESVIGKDVDMLYSGIRNNELFRTIKESIDRMGHWKGEIWNRRVNGELYLESTSIKSIQDAHAKTTHYIATFSDITQRKQDEERMHWLAHFDSLTGLANRTLLEDRCRQAISMVQASSEPLALMFLDLDNFKNVNDSFGYRIGDMLLIALSDRLSFIVRDQDTLSRLGGDDLVFVLPGADTRSAALIAERIMAATSHPFQIEGHELVVSGSIGIAMYPDDGMDFEALIKCADMAMFQAKDFGRNNFCFFTPEIQVRSMRLLQLDNALRRALERGQMHLHYQPQVSLESGDITGCEALLRWTHPELGTVSPAEFIPIAESSGLILPIGEWVLRTAVRDMKSWSDAGYNGLTVSVNLSAVQFRQPNLSNVVMGILEEYGLEANCLELELTESAAMEDPQAAIDIMDDLSRHGIRISIDDFGTGYSSLAHLKRFKISKLKIDQSFISDIDSNPDDMAIVRAVINMARSLGMQTIAEGVETEYQNDFLRRSGCDAIQGYYFSRPIPADQFEEQLRSRMRLPLA